MSELENLIQQRNDLLGKIRRINENCEGIDNEENAQRVMELNGRQSELVAAKNALASQLSALENEIAAVNQNIRDISGGGVERILQAIKNQRWYFFKNKPKVLMDRDTALLWADLIYFPWGKNNNTTEYSSDNSYAEVKNLIGQTNDDSWGGYSDWQIPTAFEFWKMIEDASFHFKAGGNWYIKGKENWCVNNNGNYAGKDLNYSGATNELHSDWYVWVIPCSHALVPADYENNISSSNNFYSETEKLQFTLNIFVENELIPLFNDAEITQLYRQIYVDKPALMRQLETLDAQITELQKNQVALTANFDYKALLRKYDAAAIGKSVVKYQAAVASVTAELLEVLQQYEEAQAETFAEFAKLTENLGAPHAAFLLKLLDFGADDARAQILSVQAQAEKLAARIDKINHGENSLVELAALENAPHASFELLVENLSEIVKNVQRRLDFFAVNKDFVTALINTLENWDEDYLPLVEFALKGNLIDAEDSPAAIRILSMLTEYKKNADSNGEKFQQAIQEMISTRKKAAEKIFLSRWLQSVLCSPNTKNTPTPTAKNSNRLFKK